MRAKLIWAAFERPVKRLFIFNMVRVILKRTSSVSGRSLRFGPKLIIGTSCCFAKMQDEFILLTGSYLDYRKLKRRAP